MSETSPSSVDRPAYNRQAQLGEARLRVGKTRQRSAMTNGSKLLVGVSGRSAWARRLKDLITEHLADLGGSDQASSAERSLIRRASTIVVELEFLEARFATAEGGAKSEDLDLYFRGANNLRRLLQAVGLQRRARDVTPNVADYVNHIKQQQQTIDEEAAP